MEPVSNGQRSQRRSGVHAVSTFTVMVASPDAVLVAEVTSYLAPFGYSVIGVGDSMTALERVRTERPDLVIADVDLPPLTGFELCQSLKQDPSLLVIPVLLVTDVATDDLRVRSLAVGADDLLGRPVHGLILRARVRSSLKAKAYLQQVLRDRGRLEELVKERIKDIERVTLGLVAALERTNRFNDTDTGLHIRRVSAYSELLARGLELEPALTSRIARYASLHDVGKVGLPDSILKKQGKLTPEEFEAMKVHTVIGNEILLDAGADPIACTIAFAHHERFDGSGYPRGLAGNGIPIEARVVALADVYDALTTRRCYKAAMGQEDALKVVLAESGKHFDPGIVRVMQRCEPQFLQVLEANAG
jgi:putative two-component system response regulator